MTRRLLSAFLVLAALLGLPGLLAASPASATERDIQISDPADGTPAISGSPDPDVSELDVSQDGTTVNVTLSFYGPVLANGSSRIVDLDFLLGLGTTSDDGSGDYSCNDSAFMDIGFGYGSPSGNFSVSGATGTLPLTSGPTFNADRTQITWSMTHSSLGNLDCIDTSGVWGHVVSTASNPYSTWNLNCDCWVVYDSVDYFDGSAANGGTQWFPDSVPPVVLSSNFSNLLSPQFRAGKTITARIHAAGVPGTSRTAFVKWFRGTTLVHAASSAAVVGRSDLAFTYTPHTPGKYQMKLASGAGTVETNHFIVMSAPSRMPRPSVAVSGHKAVVTWKAGTANFNAITRYLVDIKPGTDRRPYAWERRTTYGKLKRGYYQIRIAARNGIGTSPYSAWRSFRVL